MAKLTRPEIYKVVNDYIGVSGGYLGDFSYRSHEEFYPYSCDLDIDVSRYRPGTTREVFIRILEDAQAEDQAKILNGVLSRYPPDSTPQREKLAAEVRAMIARKNGGSLRRTSTRKRSPHYAACDRGSRLPPYEGLGLRGRSGNASTTPPWNSLSRVSWQPSGCRRMPLRH